MYKNISASSRGFTIVELLVVIVIIAALATLSIVAYNGIQQQARDSLRKSEIKSAQQALSLYYVDNDGYPACNGGVYKGGAAGQACTLSDPDVIAALVPKYVTKLPQDPKNTTGTPYMYYYALGWKVGSNGCSITNYPSVNYVIAVGLEASPKICTTSGWFARNDFGLIVGSNN